MIKAQETRVQAAVLSAIASYAGLFALLPSPAARTALLAPLVLVPVLWWMLSGPQRWIALFMPAVTLLPPLPIPIGDSGPHPAMLVALAGMFIGLARLVEWRFTFDVVTASLLLLFGVLLASAGLAFVYSGAAIGSATVARVGLFGIAVFVYLYAAHGPATAAPMRTIIRLLFLMAVVAGCFACLDFYYQLPAPAGYSQQFIWLSSGVFRRAQGLYYEASTLGNFCVFFLVMAAVAATHGAAFRPISRVWLLIGSSVIAAALAFSYSRASVLNLVLALVTLAILRRFRMNRVLLIIALSLVFAAAFIQAVFPAFAFGYWMRLSSSVQYFWTSPEGVLSGRVASWRILLEFLATHPWHAVLGIGYKTLPYSEFLGQTVIADNTYLSLLVETGVVGLLAFCVFSCAVLRAGLRAARGSDPQSKFLGLWMVCFWTGQLVQMFSGDLLTYWRVLPLYFWLLAVIVRRNREAAV